MGCFMYNAIVFQSKASVSKTNNCFRNGVILSTNCMHNEVLGYESLTQGIPGNAIRFLNRKQGGLLCSLLVLNVIMLLSEFSKGHLPLTSLNFFYPMEMSA